MRRLEAAGYADVGKTNLHEFAYGITSENPHFGTVPNPASPGRRRRLERRLGGGARRGPRRRRARHRLRRLDPYPGRLVRRRRLQADVRPRPARRLLPARAQLRPRRPMARDVAGCEALLRRSSRSSSRSTLELVELRSGRVARRGEPLVRARRRGGGGAVPARGAARLPAPTGPPRSAARSPTCTGRSSPTTRSSTARTSAARSSAASPYRHGGGRGRARARALPRAPRRSLADVDLLLTPTLAVRRAAGGRRRA